MNVTLEAIKFNHDPASATRDSLSIRKNEIESITIPEWRRRISVTPENSPAAYARSQVRGNTLTIKAQFKCDDESVKSIEVCASKQVGSILGAVKCRPIVFRDDGYSDFELFELSDVQIEQAGVAVEDISWRWHCRFNSGAAWEYLETTHHRIYSILCLPRAPWGQETGVNPRTELPWTEVLERACRWAARAKTSDEAASKITREVFGLGSSGLKYDGPGSGSSHYTLGSGSFLCTRFLKFLAGDVTAAKYVNCSDCATFVSSFANILGCDLWQSRMGFNFDTNPIRKIGANTQSRENFNFHEVAWKEPWTSADPLFDACLQVDGDSDPTGGDFQPLLAINVSLGGPYDKGYHFRLAAHTTIGHLCAARPGTHTRRKIARSTVVWRRTDPAQWDSLLDSYKFSSWEKTRALQQSLLLWHYADSIRFSPRDWQLSSSEYFAGEPGTPNLIDTFWRPTNEQGDTALNLVAYECASLNAAHLFLLKVLGEFQLPNVKRRPHFIIDYDQVAIGDVAFAGPDDLVILFARANVVILIRNVGNNLTPVSQFASDIDMDVINIPDSSEERFREMNRFYIPEGNFRVGGDIPIQIYERDLSDSRFLHKFFSSTGEVLFREDRLVYRPGVAGPQDLIAFELQSGQRTGRQSLALDVESETLAPRQT